MYLIICPKRACFMVKARCVFDWMYSECPILAQSWYTAERQIYEFNYKPIEFHINTLTQSLPRSS